MSSTIEVHTKLTLLAMRNVLRNWRHSLATILAIASGFMAVSLFDGFLKELDHRNFEGYAKRGMYGQLIIQKKDAQFRLAEDQWAYSMTKPEQDFVEGYLKGDSNFKNRVRFLNLTGMISTPSHNAVVIGVGYDIIDGLSFRGDRWRWNTIAGKPLHLGEPGKLLLGTSLGRLIDCTPEPVPSFILPDGNFTEVDRPFNCLHKSVMLSSTTETAQINAIDMPIGGLIDGAFREVDKRIVHLSLEDAQRLLDTDKITMLSVQLHDETKTGEFAKKMNVAAKSAGFNLDILPWYEHTIATFILSGMEVLAVFRNLFMLIVVAIGVISVSNTMMKSVNERTREIGTLRSLGFLRSQLVFIFSMEGFFLSILACTIGLGLTLVATFIIGELGLTYRAGILSIPITLRIKFAPIAWMVSAVVLTLLATGTAWLCSRRASAMVIADAMRHV